MGKDVSLVFKADSSGLMTSLNQMKNQVKALSRDVAEFEKIKKNAIEKKAIVQLDIEKARESMKDLKKAVLNGVEGSEKAFKEQAIVLQQLQQEYIDLGKVAKEAANQEMNYRTEVNKTSNSTQSRGTSLTKGLMQAGLGSMLGSSLQNLSGTVLTSAFGSTTGGAISGVIGSTTTGAAMGSIAGPIGTAIGAGVGAIVGAINGVSAIMEKKDDVFRSEVQNIYSLVQEQNKEILSTGIITATTLEQNKISFGTLLGKDPTNFIESIRQFSSVTPFENTDLLDTSKKLLTYQYKDNEIIPMMTKIGDAGSALGMSNDDMNWIATSLGRMKSSGKTTLEYINPLIERGIPAIQYLSESLGKSVGEVYDLISRGKINGVDASTVILNAMGEQYAGNMALQSQTTQGLQSTLNDAITQINMYQGQGYNQQRRIGLQNEISAYSGATGQLMQEAYNLIGMYEGDLENQHQASIIKAIEDVQKTSEYARAMAENDKVTIGKLYSEARANAEADYKNSDIYKAKLENELSLIGQVQDALIKDGAYVNFGFKMADEFSKGWNASRKKNMNLDASLNNQESDLWTDTSTYYLHDNPIYGTNGNATGINRVPKNGLYLLHEGESVNTAHDTRNATGNVNFGFKMADEFSKGWNISRKKNMNLDASLNNQESDLWTDTSTYYLHDNPIYGTNGNATGINRVPKNGLYLLHEGESVNTAHDTRNATGNNSGTVININVTGSNKQAIIDEVTDKITYALENLGEVS